MPTDLNQKDFTYWEAVQLLIVDTCFLNFYFLLESSKIIIGNNNFPCFSESDRCTLFIFEKKSIEYLSE